MKKPPRVSVVMSVYNGVSKLTPSIESVLAQEGVELELIIVDDGSTDGSGEVLEDFARADPRVRVERQSNQGLTRALIKGSQMAQGEFIARQDAGDAYLPGKLQKQVHLLDQAPDVSMVTCGTRFVGPKHEFLFDVVQTTEAVSRGLKCSSISELTGPSSHPSVMFRRSAYISVGGYRQEFRVAQDMDLWLRLIERGPILAIPEVMLEAEFAPGSISGSSRSLQMQVGEILIECAKRRGRGESEEDLLQQVAELKPAPIGSYGKKAAESNYFIARLLQKNADPRCIDYFNAAFRANPFSWKAILASLPARVSAMHWKLPIHRESGCP